MIASGLSSGPAPRITSRTPWLGIAQITIAPPASASPRSAVTRSESGSANSLRYFGLRRSRCVCAAIAASRAHSVTS
jgi:hypothetical protein